MIRFLFVGILTVVIVSFQNCSTGKNISLGIQAQSNQLGKTAEDKLVPLSVDLRSASSLQINNIRNTEAMTVQDMLVKPDIYYYVINLSDGTIQSFDLNNHEIETHFCLNENDKKELNNIIYTAQICEPKGNFVEDDVVCTMDYVMPYAKLGFLQQRGYSLGERNSGCDIPTDLCGDHSALLKGFARNFLINIKTKNCN